MTPTARMLASGVLVCALLSLPLAAADRSSFDAARFAMAQAADRPIIVHVFAASCATCKAQRAILDGLADDPTNQALVVLEVDAETQRDVMRSLWALSRSTIIAFKGENEIGRSVGDANPKSIKALVDQAVAN